MRKVKNIDEVVRFIRESESNIVYVPDGVIKSGYCINKNKGMIFINSEGGVYYSGWNGITKEDFLKYDVNLVEQLKKLIQLEDDPQEEIERLRIELESLSELNNNLQNDLARSLKEVEKLTVKVEEYEEYNKPTTVVKNSCKQGCVQPVQSQEEFYKDIINFLIKGK